MIDGGDRLSEEEARRVWKRAADLQGAASDQRSRALGVSTELAQHAGYDARQVRDAAAEAGIEPEFVAVALAEEHDADPGPGRDVSRWAERLSGRERRSLVVSRRFDRSTEEVYAAVQRVFSRHHLTLVDSHGQPLEGGLEVFALPRGGGGTTDFVADLVARARVEEIRLRLLPLDQRSCVATLSAPLGAARRAHVGFGATLTAGGGIVGGWAVGALGAAVVVPLGMGAVAAAAAIGGAVLLGIGAGGGLGVAGSRAAHRSGQQHGAAALERLLQTVGIELRGETSSARSITASPDEQALPERT